MAKVQYGDGSFQSQTQSQTQGPSSSRATRRSSVAASVVWEALKRKGAQRGSPKATSLSRLCCRSKIPVRNRRTSFELAENAAKELESLLEVHAEQFRYRSQDASFAIVLHGGGGRKISYECPEYGQQNVQMRSCDFLWDLASAAQSTQTSSFRRSPLSSLSFQSFPNY